MKLRVSSHTDYVYPGSTYVAISGKQFNGLDFIEEAISRGAAKIVIQKDAQISTSLQALCTKKNIALECVADARAALVDLSAHAYDYPAKKLKILAVTGTDGKTTSTYLLYHILKKAGKKVALLTGVQNIIGDQIFESTLTTAKPDFLHYFFHECVQAGMEYVAMEVSAQASTLHRIDGIEFAGCIFTNLAREHGEDYRDLEEYFAAKCDILQQKKPDAPVVVHDGPWVERVKQCVGVVFKCGFAEHSNYQIISLQETLNAQLLEISINKKWYQFDTVLIGSYNALNIAGAVALAYAMGIPPETMIVAVNAFAGAPGRLERFMLPNGSMAIVDYAHTPQAYAALLSRLKKYARRLTVVFGAAGNKDKGKRSMMGKVAADYCDWTILTNDNPRHEDQRVIMEQIMSNLTSEERDRVFCEPERRSAIFAAYKGAQTGDIIAVLGKSGELVQIIGDARVPHSDQQVVDDIIMQKVF